MKHDGEVVTVTRIDASPKASTRCVKIESIFQKHVPIGC